MAEEGTAKTSPPSRALKSYLNLSFSSASSQLFSIQHTNKTGVASSFLQHRITAFFLFAFPISILLGPRVSLPYFPQGEFRFQDFLVVGAIIFFLSSDLSRGRNERLSGSSALLWLLVFSASLFAAVAFARMDFSVSTFYTLRLLEMPVISLIIFRSLESAGTKGLRVMLGSIALGVTANLSWVAVQVATGNKPPFWSFPPGDIPQYGPSLVGEAGAFPAGQTLVILLAGAVSFHLSSSEQKARYIIFPVFLVAGIYGSILLTQSRMSIAVGSLILVVWLFVCLRRLGRRQAYLAHSLAITGFLVIALSATQLSRVRINLQSIVTGEAFEFRVSEIYIPTLQLLQEDFFLGLSPGSGRDARGGDEFHSLYIAILSDFGYLGLIIFCIGTILFMRHTLTQLVNSTISMVRLFAMWSALVAFNLLAAGTLQSSLMSATPTHLGAVIIATYFWLARSVGEPTPPIRQKVTDRRLDSA